MDTKIGSLVEGNFYTIALANSYTDYKSIKIIEVQVLLKLKNSIKLKFMIDDSIEWFPSSRIILLYDEIPIAYYRKEKLKEIENENIGTN